MTQLDLIFEKSREEQEFRDTLPEIYRERFDWYLLGQKAAYSDVAETHWSDCTLQNARFISVNG